jgi:GcrA cell cycle regulator
MTFRWTDDKLAELDRLWRDPAWSMRDIARLLRTSKNAVAGMGSRRHGPRNLDPASDAPPPGKRARVSPAVALRVPELVALLCADAEAGQTAPSNALLATRLGCGISQVAEIMAAARALGAIRVQSCFNTRRIVAGDGSWRLEPAAPPSIKGAAERAEAANRSQRASAPPSPAPPRTAQAPRCVVLSRAKCCQWPIGEPRTPGFRFCDSPEVLPGKPYCAKHAALAYTRERTEAAA